MGEERPFLAQGMREFWIKSCPIPRKALPEGVGKSSLGPSPTVPLPRLLPYIGNHPPLPPGQTHLLNTCSAEGLTRIISIFIHSPEGGLLSQFC